MIKEWHILITGIIAMFASVLGMMFDDVPAIFVGILMAGICIVWIILKNRK